MNDLPCFLQRRHPRGFGLVEVTFVIAIIGTSLLAAMEKRIVLCLNKEDWYDGQQRDELLRQIAEQAPPAVKAADVVAVRSRPTKRRRVHVLSDGTEQEEEIEVEPDISPLAKRMIAIVARDGRVSGV